MTTAIAGKKKWTNWAGNQSCRPRSEVRPVSRGELVDTVAGATAEGRRIRVPGSGHSFTGAALTDDLMVDISALSGVIDADLSSGLVKVGAGTVLVIGESAGAHLGALAMLKLRDEGERNLPPCAFVQGVFDLSGTPSVRAATPRTLLFDGLNLQRDLARLAPDRDEAGLRSPDLSPLYADLRDLPPTLLQVGEDEVLRNDSLRLAASAHAAGVEVRLERYPQLWHVFQAHVGLLQAADQAIGRAVDFLHERGWP